VETGSNKRRRSKLIVARTDSANLERAAAAGADIVQIQLDEGNLAQSGVEADHASQRQLVADALRELDWGKTERWVKIDTVDNPDAETDLDLTAAGRPDAFVLAKVSDAQDVISGATAVESAERKHGLPEGSIGVVPVIERIRALSNVEEIAVAHPRVMSLAVGPHDLGREYGYRLDLTGPSYETLYAKSRCILAARLAGIGISDIGHPVIADDEGTLRSTLWSIRLGFTTKLAHDPIQVPVIHEAFAISESIAERDR
jgi:citrate lyase subunit beta / citryl-CoA lyase